MDPEADRLQASKGYPSRRRRHSAASQGRLPTKLQLGSRRLAEEAREGTRRRSLILLLISVFG